MRLMSLMTTTIRRATPEALWPIGLQSAAGHDFKLILITSRHHATPCRYCRLGDPEGSGQSYLCAVNFEDLGIGHAQL